MNKRRVFSWIIIIGTLLQFILGNFMFDDFPGLISFILLVPFYLIVYLYYQRYKHIKYICFLSVFTLIANYFLFDYLNTFPLYSIKIRLIGIVSLVGSWIILLFTFLLLLQTEPKNKLLKGLIVFITLVNYFLFSIYIIPFTGLLVDFFGPDPLVVDNLLITILVAQYIFQILIMIAQLIIVNILDKEEEYFLKAKNK